MCVGVGFDVVCVREGRGVKGVNVGGGEGRAWVSVGGGEGLCCVAVGGTGEGDWVAVGVAVAVGMDVAVDVDVRAGEAAAALRWAAVNVGEGCGRAVGGTRVGSGEVGATAAIVGTAVGGEVGAMAAAAAAAWGGGGAGRVADGRGGVTGVGDGRGRVGVGEGGAAAAIAAGPGPDVRVARGCTGVVFSSETTGGAGGAAVTTRIGVGVGGGGATACATGTGVGVTSLATILFVEWQPGPVMSAPIVRRVTAIRFLMAVSISRLASRSSRRTDRRGNRFSTLDRGHTAIQSTVRAA
ncbi:MAG TPA: hypothetical protein VF376_03340 [Thermoanaerobaculia bacterium]